MKLNMWMIANRLSALEPEIHIPMEAPANLQSARRAYAANCVYVYQKGRDVICDAGEEGGYLVFREMKCDQVFEVVQFTFDFYREWQEMIMEATEQLDYHKIVDRSWSVFHNPMMLLDAGSHVLAMSEQYGEDDVNDDWRYLSQNGYSAVPVIQYLMKEGKKYSYYMNASAKIYHFDNKEINGNQLSVVIYYHQEACGRVNIVEKDRPLNPGDVYLLNYLTKWFSLVLGRINEKTRDIGGLGPAYSRMLLHHEVAFEELQFWKEYTQWTKGSSVRIIVLKLEQEEPDAFNCVTICNLLQTNLPHCIATRVENHISFSIPEDVGKKEAIREKIADIMKRFRLQAGISLPVDRIEDFSWYYQQALAALRFGKLFRPKETVHSFYDYAMEYMIQNADRKKLLCACHPDIRRMWIPDKANGGEAVRTLYTYLNHERSLINTANELFVHRSTLVYRLKKITDQLSYDINEVYTQDYMKLSVRMLQMDSLDSWSNC